MNSHFLQSQEWEELQKSIGRKVWRINGVLVIKVPLIFGKSYLYGAGISQEQWRQPVFAPRKGETSSTPLLDKNNDSSLKSQKQITSIARQERIVFLKLEPMSDDESLADQLLGAGFKRSKKEIQPQKTIILDIKKSEEELLAEMHEKTRYNIRLAQKKDLRFTIYDLRKGDANVFEEFWQILQKTTERDKFQPHTKEYYEKLLSNFSSQHTTYDIPYTKLFYVEHADEVVAAAIVIFYKQRATYLHGASDYEYRNLMAPYLLHWEIVRHAKEQGFLEYDLWGIDEGKWPGVTRFKRGFTGAEINYIGSYDYVFKPFWHALYKARQNLIK